MALTGGCFCGRVRYRITASLRGGRSCHCSRCRKAFSGAGSAYADVLPDSFTWTQGAENLTSYESAPGWGLCFCRTCGTTLCGTHEGAVHGVTLGSVDGDPGIQIDMHMHLDRSTYQDQIEGAMGVLSAARAEFTRRGYETQTVRIEANAISGFTVTFSTV